MKYFVIGDEDLLLGMTMVGVKGALARNAKEAEEAFKLALSDKNNAIILISEKSASHIRNLINDYMFKNKLPLICEIEGSDGSDENKPSLRDLANKAIGVKL